MPFFHFYFLRCFQCALPNASVLPFSSPVPKLYFWRWMSSKMSQKLLDEILKKGNYMVITLKIIIIQNSTYFFLKFLKVTTYL